MKSAHGLKSFCTADPLRTVPFVNAPERIGRDGLLILNYERQGSRTALVDSYFHAPFHILPPMDTGNENSAYTQILNPGGGLVSGDRLEIRVQAGQDTHVLLTTPSSTRVYRSVKEPVYQQVTLDIQPGAVLEWFPDTTIPFAGSRFCQRIQATLSRDSTLLLWDAFCAGRIARHERWVFSELQNEICVVMPDGGRVLERTQLVPDQRSIPEPAIAEDYDYFASLYILSARSTDWIRLREKLDADLDPGARSSPGAVSILPVPGLMVRLAARSARALSRQQETLWSICRRFLLDLPLPNLRKY